MNPAQQKAETAKIQLFAAREKRARLESSYLRALAQPDANKEHLKDVYIPRLRDVNAVIIRLHDSLDSVSLRAVLAH